MTYYTIFVWRDIEPHLSKPFDSTVERDNHALYLRKEHGEAHGIFWMDILDLEGGHDTPQMGAYSESFFNEDE